MSSLAKNVLATRAENQPPMLEKGGYDTWQSQITVAANEASERLAETRMVKELMEGTQLTKQERESKLANEFDRFISKKGENLREVSFDQLYTYLKQNELDANEVHALKARFPDPLALIANTYNPPLSYSSYKLDQRGHLQVGFDFCSFVLAVVTFVTTAVISSLILVPTLLPTDELIASLNKVMMFLTTAISSRYPSTNNQLETSSNPQTQENIQDGRVVVQNVQGRQKGNVIMLNNVQQRRGLRTLNGSRKRCCSHNKKRHGLRLMLNNKNFLVDGLKGFDSDCEDLQLNVTPILMTEKVDTYDLEVDDAPTASAIFMAKLSPAGSINGDSIKFYVLSGFGYKMDTGRHAPILYLKDPQEMMMKDMGLSYFKFPVRFFEWVLKGGGYTIGDKETSCSFSLCFCKKNDGGCVVAMVVVQGEKEKGRVFGF
ncbi:hypothetical protein Tco_1142760 [Tanacetum coccineum]